ncbi:MAG: nitroreductase family protein [Bacteroidaceae bacterium]|nr:nitroreductase family protein [Bacteroidaceae bacterium]
MKKIMVAATMAACLVLAACGGQNAKSSKNHDCGKCEKHEQCDRHEQCEKHANSDACENCDKHGKSGVSEAIMGRRSIRKYQDKAVEKEKLQQIAKAGVNAPNAMNAQNWAVRISQDKELINGIRGTHGGTALIFVAGRNAVDCGLMGQNMMLAAYDMGLGTVIMTGPLGAIKGNADIMKKLDLPEGMELQFVIEVGYPDEKPDAKTRNMDVIKFLE